MESIKREIKSGIQIYMIFNDDTELTVERNNEPVSIRQTHRTADKVLFVIGNSIIERNTNNKQQSFIIYTLQAKNEQKI